MRPVTGRTPTMRADIGYTPVVPAAATIGPQYLQLPTRPAATQRLATHFVSVHVKRDGDPVNSGAATSSTLTCRRDVDAAPLSIDRAGVRQTDDELTLILGRVVCSNVRVSSSTLPKAASSTDLADRAPS